MFQQMGCELRTTTGVEIVNLDTGARVGRVLFLFNPANGRTQRIEELPADERISALEVEAWERRLGLTIPKPGDA